MASKHLADLPQFSGSIIGSEILMVQTGSAVRQIRLDSIYASASVSVATSASISSLQVQVNGKISSSLYATDSSSLSTRVTRQETSSSLYVTASSSLSTRVTNTEGTASIFVLASSSLQRYNVDSGSFNTNIGTRLLTSTYTTDSSSFTTRITRTESTASVFVLTSASLQRYNVDSGSFNTNIGTRLLISTYTTDSASFTTRITRTESTASAYVLTSASLQRYNVDSGSFNTNIGTRLLTSTYTTDSSSLSTRVTRQETSSSLYLTASSSLSTRVTNTEGTSSIFVLASASLQRYNIDSGSFNTNIGTRLLTSTYATDSSSFSTRVTTTEGNIINISSRDGYVYSDGTTSNRAQIQGPFDSGSNSRGYIAGVATAEWCGWVDVPSSGWGGAAWIFSMGSAATAPFQNNSLSVRAAGANDLTITQAGVDAANDRRNFSSSVFRTTYSGQRIWLRVKLTQGSTNPLVEVNAVDISSTFTATTSGTVPAWLDAAMVPTYHLTGYGWLTGKAPIGQWIIGSLTTAESLSWMLTGQPPVWVANGGQCSTPPNFTFVGGLSTGTCIGSSTSSTGITVTKTAGGTGSYSVANASIMGPLGGNIFGVPLRPYIISGNISYSSGTGTVVLQMDSGTLLSISAGGNFNAIIYGPDANINHRFSINGNVSGDAFVIVLSNFKIFPCGALSIPSIQPISVIDDSTSIGANGARLLGMVPVCKQRNWRISADTWTNGSQYLLTGNVLDQTEDVIDTMEQTTTGTPTTSVGSVSSGAQYKTSAALSAGINPVTLVTRKLATNDIYVTSNSTTLVRTTITGHRAG